MNVRTATLLSIAGVLAAGTAAVAVNTQVLSGSAIPGELAAPLTLPVATQVYAVPGGTAGVMEAPTGGNTVLVAENSGSIAPQVTGGTVEFPTLEPPATTVMSFQIGDAGVATVDTVGGLLRIVEVSPASGWTVAAADGSGTVRVDVELVSTTTKVKFGAFLSGGDVITSVSSESLPTSSGGEYDDDDHDDDDHGDDDHGDDDHDDDHDRGDDDD